MEWRPIETAEGNDLMDEEYIEVLLTDGNIVRVGCVIRRATGGKRGLVSGFVGHMWSHWMPLPQPPTPEGRR